MSNQQTLIGRLNHWLRRGKSGNGDLPLMLDVSQSEQRQQSNRSGSFLPWTGQSKRDQAIANLQNGFGTLTDLMGTIRDNLESQGRRQDELLGYLSKMPDMLQTLPESSRVQGETLKAIHVQLTQQNLHQNKLTEILDKVSNNTGDQVKMLDNMRESVDSLHKNDQSIVSNMSSVGSAMQNLSKNSQTSTQVLENLRDNLNNRDGQLERILHRQASRFTTMLAVAIFLSIAALAAVLVMGYLMMNRNTETKPMPASPVGQIQSVK